jgi:SAM-dependent methyltransferase
MNALDHDLASDSGFERADCPRCGSSSEQRVVIVGRDHLHEFPGEFHACECSACGLWFLNPRPITAQRARFYPDDYAPHAEAPSSKPSEHMRAFLGRELGYKHLAGMPSERSRWPAPLQRARLRWKAAIDLIPAYVRGGTVLEIGCASGTRLAGLRTLGWTNLSGIELVPAAAQRARERGFSVLCGDVETTLEQLADASLDVVITSMVLEHLANPFAVVAMIARKVKPGGQLLFSTITRDSLDARVFGPYWGGFDFPRHLVFLRDADIDAMVRDNFDIIERAHHPAPQDFTRSAKWREPEGHWIDRAILSSTHAGVRNSVGSLLALARLSCRVSYRCRRKG